MVLPWIILGIGGLTVAFGICSQIYYSKNRSPMKNTISMSTVEQDSHNALVDLRNITVRAKKTAVAEWDNDFKMLSWHSLPKHLKEKQQIANGIKMSKGLPLKFATESEPWNPTVSQMQALGVLETVTERSWTGEVLMESHRVIPQPVVNYNTVSRTTAEEIQEYVANVFLWNQTHSTPKYRVMR